MKNLIQLLILSSLLFSVLFSQAQSNEKLDNSLFWEVTGNGIEKPSYVFGTIHLIPKSEFKTSKFADNKLKNADHLVMEMVIDVPLKTKIEWAKQMMLPNGNTVEDFLNDEEKIALRSLFIDSLNIHEAKYEKYIKFKPITLYSLIIKESVDKIKSYEEYFSKLAKKNKIEVIGLETFEYQLAIFDSIPNQDQVHMFFEGNFVEELESLFELYKKQDIDEMASLVKSDDEYSKLENELLVNRNTNWIEKIVPMFNDKSIFMAVGAAHLGGDQGIIRLLKEKGYTLKPLEF
jgi:uncharacterized protein YbaP (TraB family)